MCGVSRSAVYLSPCILFERLIKVGREMQSSRSVATERFRASSSRATTIPWRLRCGEPIRREDLYSRKESDLDSHTCRARLFVSSSDASSGIRRDGFAFARVPIDLAKRPRSIATYMYIFRILLKSIRETWPTLIRGLLDWSVKILFWIDTSQMSTRN